MSCRESSQCECVAIKLSGDGDAMPAVALAHAQLAPTALRPRSIENQTISLLAHSAVMTPLTRQVPATRRDTLGRYRRRGAIHSAGTGDEARYNPSSTAAPLLRLSNMASSDTRTETSVSPRDKRIETNTDPHTDRRHADTEAQKNTHLHTLARCQPMSGWMAMLNAVVGAARPPRDLTLTCCASCPYPARPSW
jgi:hypothetical protein